jgi:hypothetical protein
MTAQEQHDEALVEAMRALRQASSPKQVPMDSPEYDAMMQEKIAQYLRDKASSPAASRKTPRSSGSGSSSPTR